VLLYHPGWPTQSGAKRRVAEYFFELTQDDQPEALEQVRAALLAAFQHPMRPDSTIENRLGSAQRDLKVPLGGNVWVRAKLSLCIR
jgi:hypothetical protein